MEAEEVSPGGERACADGVDPGSRRGNVAHLPRYRRTRLLNDGSAAADFGSRRGRDACQGFGAGNVAGHGWAGGSCQGRGVQNAAEMKELRLAELLKTTTDVDTDLGRTPVCGALGEAGERAGAAETSGSPPAMERACRCCLGCDRPARPCPPHCRPRGMRLCWTWNAGTCPLIRDTVTQWESGSFVTSRLANRVRLHHLLPFRYTACATQWPASIFLKSTSSPGYRYELWNAAAFNLHLDLRNTNTYFRWSLFCWESPFGSVPAEDS